MKTYAEVGWTPEDIVSAANDQGRHMTRKEAYKWLIENPNYIRDRLVELGCEVIDSLLDLPEPDLKATKAKYKGRRICELTADECKELIVAYGDKTEELCSNHDLGDWQSILMDNMGVGTDLEII